MHFIGEACYRRPLESKLLVFFRGSTSIIMALIFVVYCGYLIRQIVLDVPLLRVSSENIPYSYPSPDIEICAQNTSLTIVRCDLTYANWTTIPLSNCYDKIRFGNHQPQDISWCYLFEANGTVNYGVETSYPAESSLIKRIDIYWRIDNTINATSTSLSVPSLAIQLYSPSFNRWTIDESSLIPQQAQRFRNMVLGNYRATSFYNTTSSIFFVPSKYRAIAPNSYRSVIGFEPSYVDLITLKTTQHNWPLHPNENITNEVYHGFFTIQPSQAMYSVETEQRQHTTLAAIALAGGAYGVLTTIYILFFGMTRLAPCGLVHHIPNLVNFGKEKFRRNSDSNLTLENHQNIKRSTPWLTRQYLFKHNNPNNTSQMKLSHKTSIGYPDTHGQYDSKNHTRDSSSEHTSDHHHMKSIYKQKLIPSLHDSTAEVIPSSSHDPNRAAITYQRVIQEAHSQLEHRNKELEYRVEELEMILREYFLNTEYLDQVRQRHRVVVPFKSCKSITGLPRAPLIEHESDDDHHQQSVTSFISRENERHTLIDDAPLYTTQNDTES
ncbi:hypothetical protein BDF14DRAFT_1841344 [Spinellus fusiger]|nr:hypothetical protein BDF14DRAFT_1841344 [Spinellus fusiger]